MSNMFGNVSNLGGKGGHAHTKSYLDYTLDDANQMVKKTKTPDLQKAEKEASSSSNEAYNSDELLQDEINEEEDEQKESTIINDDRSSNVNYQN